MSLFNKIKLESTNFTTPQEMYQDNRKKTINGPLDYQSKMIDAYMEKGFRAKDVALELPTGAGKTLIGLLIGEFRRRKNKEKVLFVCPNNQLVNQVVEKANSVYGIKAHPFTGRLINYSQSAKAAYDRAEIIAVTNYSSLFIKNTFFKDADIIIFDDAHGAENYIASNWSLEIERDNHEDLFNTIVESIKNELDYTQLSYLKNNGPDRAAINWIDKFPNLKFLSKKQDLIEIIDARATQENNLIYAWNNIKEHLNSCNLFLSSGKLLIRPYIPPTLTHEPFNKAKQRIYMSATLGESGELERTIGVSKITRLPIVDEWKQKSIGRRYFVFPDASFKPQEYENLFIEMNKKLPRSLMLVQDKKSVQRFSKFIEENMTSEIYTIDDIEQDDSIFTSSKNAVAILANRYDGIDMEGDKCHLLFINQIPNGTGLQEKFLSTKLAASVLFEERIRTKLIQAVGRCTRSNTDYAVVCIMGDDLLNTLTSRKKIENFPPELRAELEFGYTYSAGLENFDNILLAMDALINKTEDWDIAEEQILGLRDDFINEDKSNRHVINELLNECAKFEVKFQYDMWKEDYEKALENIEQIITRLNGNALVGYKAYWNYTGAYVSYLIYLQGVESYHKIAKEYLNKAANNSRNVSWFKKILPNKEESKENAVAFGLMDVVERIEEQIYIDGVKSPNRFEKRAERIIGLLKSEDGNEFERGHEELGILLGYITGNSNEHTSPDPWWIINNDYCIVSEDKIYTGENKKILTKHVRQALTHETWIRENIKSLNREVAIDTVFITTTTEFEENVDLFGEEIYLVLQEDFVTWAENAVGVIRRMRRSFSGTGDMIWRLEAMKILEENKLTPVDLLNFIKQTKLKDLSNKN
ncbi:DEAD/DEAH box helicase family protein [Lysinibacillus agricola]|uniref:DEAD/DEAH box helicase family protein n=1 Tax=Lysinibacillus agricola TaxID=2590012 RepID=UPI003C1C48EF